MTTSRRCSVEEYSHVPNCDVSLLTLVIRDCSSLAPVARLRMQSSNSEAIFGLLHPGSRETNVRF